MSDQIVPRPRYTSRIAPFVDVPVIKVITGARRSGKSTVLDILAQQIRQDHPRAQVVHLNLESTAGLGIRALRSCSTTSSPERPTAPDAPTSSSTRSSRSRAGSGSSTRCAWTGSAISTSPAPTRGCSPATSPPTLPAGT